MAASTEFSEFIKDQLAALGHITVRRMFGGAGVFCDGLMLGLIADDVLYFKVDDGNRAPFDAEDSQPLSYTSKGRQIALGYWRAPVRLLDEPDEMLDWARAALAAARRGADKKLKPKRTPRPA